MGLFSKLFGSKKLTLEDSDFGTIKSHYIRGEEVGWSARYQLLNDDIEILIDGNKEGIDEAHKKRLQNFLSKGQSILIECEISLKEEFENADMPFTSLRDHFKPLGITVYPTEIEFTFEQIEDPCYFFNVYFNEDGDKYVSVDS